MNYYVIFKIILQVSDVFAAVFSIIQHSFIRTFFLTPDKGLNSSCFALSEAKLIIITDKR